MARRSGPRSGPAPSRCSGGTSVSLHSSSEPQPLAQPQEVMAPSELYRCIKDYMYLAHITHHHDGIPTVTDDASYYPPGEVSSDRYEITNRPRRHFQN